MTPTIMVCFCFVWCLVTWSISCYSADLWKENVVFQRLHHMSTVVSLAQVYSVCYNANILFITVNSQSFAQNVAELVFLLHYMQSLQTCCNQQLISLAFSHFL